MSDAKPRKSKRILSIFLALILLFSVCVPTVYAEGAASREDFIRRLYSVCLGREPGESEVNHYLWLLNDRGNTGAEIAYEFIFNDEFKMKNYCDYHYALALYKAFMGREPGNSEVQYYEYLLQQGKTREDIFNQFVASNEFKDICADAGIPAGSQISYSGKGTRAGGYCSYAGCTAHEKKVEFAKRLYRVCLDREPAQNEIDAWHYYLVHGDHTGTTACYQFLTSEEFALRDHTTTEYIKHLYDAMLDRRGSYSEEELAYWAWEININGMTRRAAFEKFAASEEFGMICQNYNVVCADDRELSDDVFTSLRELSADRESCPVGQESEILFTMKAYGVNSTIFLRNEYNSTAFAMLDNGSNGDATAGDGIYTARVRITVSDEANVGFYAQMGNAYSNRVSIRFGGTAGEISYSRPAEENIVEDGATGEYYVDNEILLTAVEGIRKEQIRQLVNGIGGTIVGCIELTNDYQIRLAAKKTMAELNNILQSLNASSLVEEASLHNYFRVETSAVPNDAKWSSEEWSADYPGGSNWGVEAINAMSAWDYRSRMSNVNVGVIDSMFDTGHEDLNFAKVWNNPASISDQYALLRAGDVEHGTHVSGTIAAAYNNGRGVAGVAPTASLYGYSILGSDTDPVALENGFQGGMEWKYALANLITANCRVINVSMGLATPSRATSELQAERYGDFLGKLLSKGYDFLIVQAAGNDGIDAFNNGIFCGITRSDVKDRVIVVGAMGNNGSHTDSFQQSGARVFDGYYYASFSNFGDRVDVVAPGVKIYSTVPGNRYESDIWNGTSMAAPHVTGIAALCFAVNPTLSGKQVKDIIVNSAPTTVVDNNSGHPTRSYPVASAAAAVELALVTGGGAIAPVNPANGIVMGLVYNVGSSASVTAYRISDYDGNLSDYASSTGTDVDGNFELILEPGTYYVNVYAEGYVPFAVGNVVVRNDEITYLDNIYLVRDSGTNESNTISGVVRNALTGSAVEGATLRFRTGWGKKTGALAKKAGSSADAVVTTNSSGSYSLNLRVGCYTAEVSRDGYITGYVNVVCANAGEESSQDAVITPVLDDDEYRIVLTWSETPSDLDSHISGPLSSGSRFHVYYADSSAYEGGETVANLDVDDVTSYGPETITLKKNHSGVYRYAVHDYTNRSSTSSRELSMSGAKVELYCGNDLIATYHVPTNVSATVWNVFELEGETLRSLNTMEFESNPSDVVSMNSVAANSVALRSFAVSTNGAPASEEKDYDHDRVFSEVEEDSVEPVETEESVEIEEIVETEESVEAEEIVETEESVETEEIVETEESVEAQEPPAPFESEAAEEEEPLTPPDAE